MTFDRRSFLKIAALAPLVDAIPHPRLADAQPPDAKADYTIRIATGLVDLAPGHIVSTTLYNDQFPGPLLPPSSNAYHPWPGLPPVICSWSR